MLGFLDVPPMSPTARTHVELQEYDNPTRSAISHLWIPQDYCSAQMRGFNPGWDSQILNSNVWNPEILNPKILNPEFLNP